MVFSKTLKTVNRRRVRIVRSSEFLFSFFVSRYVHRFSLFPRYQVEHNNTKHAILLRHVAHSDMLYESFGELKLNTSAYSVSNVIDLKLHEITLDIHLDQYDNLYTYNIDVKKIKINRYRVTTGGLSFVGFATYFSLTI